MHQIGQRRNLAEKRDTFTRLLVHPDFEGCTLKGRKMETKESSWPEPKSPREFKPWETLMPFYEPVRGLYMYEQAAREIADAEGLDDDKLTALQQRMIEAIHAGELPTRERNTGFRCPANKPEFLSLVSVDDVNEWLSRRAAPYRWTPSKAGQVAPDVAPANELPDPERRLVALRELGGTPKWKRGRDGVQGWQFKGIKSLVEQEKHQGRKRHDEKTIREDLREAAEAESTAKRLGKTPY